MFKVGITQRVEMLKDRNERRDCLDQAWTRLLVKIGFLPVPLPNLSDDVEELVSGIGLNGVLLTGGNDLASCQASENAAPERDLFEGKLLDVCAAHMIPVLGVCRGLQMMVVHYGGKLTPVPGHVGCEHGITADSGNGFPLGDRPTVNSFHNFGVRPEDIGRHLRLLACAPDGSVEAVAHLTKPQWAIMWHPERRPYDPADAALIQTLLRGRQS